MKKGLIIIGLIFGLTIFILSPSFHVRDLIAASPQIGKPSDKPKPDLVVEKVWLDLQCHIYFKIKNAGNGSISDTEHSKGVVRVYYGREHEDFYFTRASSVGKPALDAAGALKSPGGSVQYDTQIKLDSPISVVVHVDADKKIIESKEENNRVSQSLTPRCQVAAQTAPAQVVIPSDPGPNIDVDKDKIKPAREREDGIGRDLGDRKLQQAPIIIIDEPRQYSLWYAGCQYKIAWRTNVEMGFKIKILETDQVVQTFTPTVLKKIKTGGYYVYSTSWTVPDNWPRREITYPYGVKVESLDGKFSEQSEYLNIHGDFLQEVRPMTGWYTRRGERLEIIWNYAGCTFKNFDIILESYPSPSIKFNIATGVAVRPRMVTHQINTQEYNWIIPRDFYIGFFQIRLVGNKRAYSGAGPTPSVIAGPIFIMDE